MTDRRYALTIEDSAPEHIDHQPAAAIDARDRSRPADQRHRCSGRFSPTGRLVLRRLSKPSHAGGARLRRFRDRSGPKGKLALGGWNASWQSTSEKKVRVSLSAVDPSLLVPESVAVGRAPSDTYTRRKEGFNGWTS